MRASEPATAEPALTFPEKSLLVELSLDWGKLGTFLVVLLSIPGPDSTAGRGVGARTPQRAPEKGGRGEMAHAVHCSAVAPSTGTTKSVEEFRAEGEMFWPHPHPPPPALTIICSSLAGPCEIPFLDWGAHRLGGLSL